MWLISCVMWLVSCVMWLVSWVMFPVSGAVSARSCLYYVCMYYCMYLFLCHLTWCCAVWLVSWVTWLISCVMWLVSWVMWLACDISRRSLLQTIGRNRGLQKGKILVQRGKGGSHDQSCDSHMICDLITWSVTWPMNLVTWSSLHTLFSSKPAVFRWLFTLGGDPKSLQRCRHRIRPLTFSRVWKNSSHLRPLCSG